MELKSRKLITEKIVIQIGKHDKYKYQNIVRSNPRIQVFFVAWSLEGNIRAGVERCGKVCKSVPQFKYQELTRNNRLWGGVVKFLLEEPPVVVDETRRLESNQTVLGIA